MFRTNADVRLTQAFARVLMPRLSSATLRNVSVTCVQSTNVNEATCTQKTMHVHRYPRVCMPFSVLVGKEQRCTSPEAMLLLPSRRAMRDKFVTVWDAAFAQARIPN